MDLVLETQVAVLPREPHDRNPAGSGGRSPRSPLVVYLMSCSPQPTQYVFPSILALAWEDSLHCLMAILLLTTLPQLGQKRIGGLVSRWLKLGHGVMFILIPVGQVAVFKHESR